MQNFREISFSPKNNFVKKEDFHEFFALFMSEKKIKNKYTYANLDLDQWILLLKNHNNDHKLSEVLSIGLANLISYLNNFHKLLIHIFYSDAAIKLYFCN